ncbi:MAG: tyrosine-type recombinase/integrase [Cardiobacteriaceae bacterium]|nr:tyrosine-type recombinase/integrase [Cardiobacteriaceae bacterium]
MKPSSDITQTKAYKEYITVHFPHYLSDILGLSPSTIYTYCGAINRFMLFVERQGWLLQDLTKAEIEVYCQTMNLTPHSQYLFIASMRNLFRYLSGIQIVDNPVFDNMHNPKISKHLSVFYTIEEIKRLLAVPDTNTLMGLRNRAILQMLYDTGMRNSELRNLHVSDVDIIQKFVCVTGKRQKQRLIPLTNETLFWIEAWAKRRFELIAEKEVPYLFLSSAHKKLSHRALLTLVKRYAREAGLRRSFTVHSLRHAYASHMINNGTNLRVVQELLGHSSINTTQLYIQLRHQRLKNLHRKYHPRA